MRVTVDSLDLQMLTLFAGAYIVENIDAKLFDTVFLPNQLEKLQKLVEKAGKVVESSDRYSLEKNSEKVVLENMIDTLHDTLHSTFEG